MASKAFGNNTTEYDEMEIDNAASPEKKPNGRRKNKAGVDPVHRAIRDGTQHQGFDGGGKPVGTGTGSEKQGSALRGRVLEIRTRPCTGFVALEATIDAQKRSSAMVGARDHDVKPQSDSGYGKSDGYGNCVMEEETEFICQREASEA